MRVNLLEILYDKYNSNGVKISKNLMSELLQLPDKTIKYIIENDIDLSKLEEYVTTSLFKAFDANTQIVILKSDNGIFLKFDGSHLLEKYSIKELQELLNIFYNCKSFLNIKFGVEFITKIKYMSFDKIKKILKIILDSVFKPCAGYATVIALNEKVIKSEYIVELTRIVANAKTPWCAQLTEELILYENNSWDKNIVELAKIVANAKNQENAIYAKNLVCDNIALSNENIVELTRIIANAKTEEHADHASFIVYEPMVLLTENDVELTKIIANAKTSEHAGYAKSVAWSMAASRNENIVELTRIVANAKTPWNAKVAKAIACNDAVLKSGKVVELVTLIVATKEKVAGNIACLIDHGFLDIVIALIDVFEKRINVNNFSAVSSMLISGDYEKSSNPIESLKKILRSTNDYKHFENVYEDSEIDAINAAKDLDKEFPGINITGETYVKTKKVKKVTNTKEL